MVFMTRSETRRRRCSQGKSRISEFTKLTTKKINVKSEDQQIVSETKSNNDPGKISESVAAELVTPRTLRKKACLMMKETSNVIKNIENKDNTNKSEHMGKTTHSEVKYREFVNDTLTQKTRASNLANMDSLQTKETKEFTSRRSTRQSARFASENLSTSFKDTLKVHKQDEKPMASIDVKNVDSVLNSEAAQTENDVLTEMKSKQETNILCPVEKFQDSDITKVDNLQSDQTTPEEKDSKSQSTRKSAIKASENVSNFLRSPEKMGTKLQYLDSTQEVQNDSNEVVPENKSQVVEMELKQDAETIPSVQKVEDTGETDIDKHQIVDTSSKGISTPRRLTRKSVSNTSENINITASVSVMSPRKTRATRKSSAKASVSVTTGKASIPMKSPAKVSIPLKSPKKVGTDLKSLGKASALVKSPGKSSAPLSLEVSSTVESPQEANVPLESPEATSAPVGSPEATSVPVWSPEATSVPVWSPEATSAPVWSPEVTSAPVGSPEATSAPVGSPEATSAPVGSPEATSAPVGSPEVTGAFVENSARANTKLSKVIESSSNNKSVSVLDFEEIRNSSLGEPTENSNQFVMSQSAGEENNTSAKPISKIDIRKPENREDTGNKMDQETPVQRASFGNTEESEDVPAVKISSIDYGSLELPKAKKETKSKQQVSPKTKLEAENDKTKSPAQDMNKPLRTTKEGKQDSKENKGLKRKLTAQDADGILFIESLPESVEASDIKTLFSENKIKLKKHKTLKAGAAIVQLKDWSEIGKAVSLLSENFLGKAIRINSLKDDRCDIDHCLNQNDWAPIPEKLADIVITEDGKCKLVVNNLPADCKLEDLAKLFPVATAIKLYSIKRYAIVKNAKQTASLHDENVQKADVDESCMEQKVPKKKVKNSKLSGEEKECSRILYIEGDFKHFTLLQLSNFFDGKILLKKDRYIVVKFKDIKTSKKYFRQLMKLTNNSEIVTVKYLPKRK